MRAAPAYAVLVAGLVPAACAPIPVQEAEAQCLRQVQPRNPISGEIGMGVTSDGNFATKVDVDVSLGALNGRDPSEVYARCVYNKSGRFPTRPLYSLTD